MNNELMLYNRGHLPVPRKDRQVARVGKAIYDTARVAAFQADATLAVTGHMMEGLTELHKHATRLAGEDVTLQMIMGEMVGGAIHQCRRIQQGMTSNWGF